MSQCSSFEHTDAPDIGTKLAFTSLPRQKMTMPWREGFALPLSDEDGLLEDSAIRRMQNPAAADAQHVDERVNAMVERIPRIGSGQFRIDRTQIKVKANPSSTA
jgi:hypothetical protein